MSDDTEYDIIFAGGGYQSSHRLRLTNSSLGGTAACLIAGRLAAADPSLKLLVLEAGPHTRGLDAHRQPARYTSHLHPSSKTVTFNVAKPSEKLGGRAIVVPSGRCVGGGSSVNCKFDVTMSTHVSTLIVFLVMMYTRGSASDYDDWETVHKNVGWGSKDLLPLFKKVVPNLLKIAVADKVHRLRRIK
jgi:alcohol oxidase